MPQFQRCDAPLTPCQTRIYKLRLELLGCNVNPARTLIKAKRSKCTRMSSIGWIKNLFEIGSRGLFHKTLLICNLWICCYGRILTVNLLVNCRISVNYGKMAVNYVEKSFMEQAPSHFKFEMYFWHQFKFAAILLL